LSPPAEDLPVGARFLPKPYLINHLKAHLDALVGPAP
jgi:hypothetical protein